MWLDVYVGFKNSAKAVRKICRANKNTYISTSSITSNETKDQATYLLNQHTDWFNQLFWFLFVVVLSCLFVCCWLPSVFGLRFCCFPSVFCIICMHVCVYINVHVGLLHSAFGFLARCKCTTSSSTLREIFALRTNTLEMVRYVKTLSAFSCVFYLHKGSLTCFGQLNESLAFDTGCGYKPRNKQSNNNKKCRDWMPPPSNRHQLEPTESMLCIALCVNFSCFSA